ncbi:MAG TPA: hypothetical protein VN851_06660, partial [Thermoanaerobaculia bacterium]|nr:hypothetical protein [Thermoanaerobaculia bacterium]
MNKSHRRPRLQLSKETVRGLSGELGGVVGALIASNGPDDPCQPTVGFSCSEVAICTCFGCSR